MSNCWCRVNGANAPCHRYTAKRCGSTDPALDSPAFVQHCKDVRGTGQGVSSLEARTLRNANKDLQKEVDNHKARISRLEDSIKNLERQLWETRRVRAWSVKSGGVTKTTYMDQLPCDHPSRERYEAEHGKLEEWSDE